MTLQPSLYLHGVQRLPGTYIVHVLEYLKPYTLRANPRRAAGHHTTTKPDRTHDRSAPRTPEHSPNNKTTKSIPKSLALAASRRSSTSRAQSLTRSTSDSQMVHGLRGPHRHIPSHARVPHRHIPSHARVALRSTAEGRAQDLALL